MIKNASEFNKTLGELLGKGEFDNVDAIIQDLVPTEFTGGEVKKTLNLIRKKRQFKSLESAAKVFINYDIKHPFVLRQLAQSLIEQNHLEKAITVLDEAYHNLNENDPEMPEIIGLLGRANKQLFVETGDGNYLHRAICSYQQGWETRNGDYRWHGINLVALLERGLGDKIIDVNSNLAKSIASKILSEINELEYLHVWDYGTAMEASLALDDKETTLFWAKKYALHPEADAFELGSSLRQLREIWQVNENTIVSALEPVMEYEILQRKGGAVSIASEALSDKSGFEAVYGNESYVQVTWLQNMFERLKSVARVFNKNTGEPCGTGFLIKASNINPVWGDELVFITNAHVVSDDPLDEAVLRPNLASAEFTQLPGSPKIELGNKRFHSSRELLDTWICDISPKDEFRALDLSLYSPLIADEHDKPQRVYVLGHPNGGALVISLYSNDLVGYELPYVHYTSPTEGGSSGSPVLTRNLETFALHHRSISEKQVNEGVLLQNISDQIKA